MAFPKQRMRRLRENELIRNFIRETDIHARQLVYPIFVRSGKKVKKGIYSMPGIYQYSIDEALKEAERAYKEGIRAVLFFGIPPEKDALGTGAYTKDGIIQKTLRAFKKALPELICITDLCLCEYTSHGHCGQIDKCGRLLNDETLKLLQKTAVSHAKAGADLIAPSAMMDGMVQAIRGALDRVGMEGIPIMSYAVKYASHFYGPFRSAAESSPRQGNRKSYQMDYSNVEEALREVALDIEEGADIVMVKPALAYLDIIRRVKDHYHVPLAAYHVSGEYAMIKAAVKAGYLAEKESVMEILNASRRAGADVIISYWARQAAIWLKEESKA